MAQCRQGGQLMQPCSRSFIPKQSRWFAAGALLFGLSAEAAPPDPLSQCAAISDQEQRLRCYDEITAARDSGICNAAHAADICGAGTAASLRLWYTRAKYVSQC